MCAAVNAMSVSVASIRIFPCAAINRGAMEMVPPDSQSMMSPRQRAGGTVLATLILLLGFAGQAFAERPNILLLVAEDMSARVRSFGDQVAVTPNLDALAARGIRLPNVFTTAGVCAPSRAALITGMHQISTGAQHMRTSSRPDGAYKAVPPPDVKAFPELLRGQGYYTFTGHKLDYQFSGTLAGSGPVTIWDAEGGNDEWRGREPGQPFLGLINFEVTHESGTFAPLGNWPFSAMHAFMQIVRYFRYGNISDGDPVAPDSVILPPYYPDIPSVRRGIARHYNNIAAMDLAVGEVLKRLVADGLADNTIIMWTTDHGDGLPRAKRELYDSGIKVPMIIYWPERWRPEGLVPGSIDSRLVSFVDIAPTILELAGADSPSYMHGQNFLDGQRPYVFASRDRIDSVNDRQRAVRDKRYKYIRSWQPALAGGHELAFRDNQAMTRDMRALWRSGKLTGAQAKWFEPVGREQLYDLDQDPHELNNLVGDSKYESELLRLRLAMDAWLAEIDDTSELTEAKMVDGFLCGEEQCETPRPRVEVRDGKAEILSEVEGASITYRLDNQPWRLYVTPLAVDAAKKLRAKAVRYGWKESEEIAIRLPIAP